MAASYDGKTCPGCDPCIGYGHAYLFNALNRMPNDLKFMEHLMNAKVEYEHVPDPQTDHPALIEYVRVYRLVMEAMNGVVLDGMTIRWLPGTLERLRNLFDEWADAFAAVDDLLEDHREDNRHSRGEMNVLRESKGSKHTLWGRRPGDTSYDYWVQKCVSTGALSAHLDCSGCGSAYQIHKHFREKLAADPTFYGAFWCEVCRANVPWQQINHRSH